VAPTTPSTANIGNTQALSYLAGGAKSLIDFSAYGVPTAASS
jgi:hypothetical protein